LGSDVVVNYTPKNLLEAARVGERQALIAQRGIIPVQPQKGTRTQKDYLIFWAFCGLMIGT
jgi:carboxypeptidase C (cathepsin A)